MVDDIADLRADASERPALTDNVDPERFPDGMAELDPTVAADRLAHLRDRRADWEWLDARLPPRGRRLLRDRLAFHVLGHRHARVGPDRATVEALLAEARDRLVVERDVTPIRFAGSPATHRFDLRPLGFPIALESYTLGVQGTFQLQQYLAPGNPAAHPRAGDVAVDAGACFGETALWLAHLVGPAGRVHSLEFGAANLRILQRNLRANPELADRVEVVERALHDMPDRTLRIELDGPASTIAGDDAAPGGTAAARTTTLDALDLPRVDFVKMDIEGSEPAALAGARATLRRDRPRLALAVYHHVDHIHALARAVDDLDLGYRFDLGHFTMHEEETVLYAWTEP